MKVSQKIVDLMNQQVRTEFSGMIFYFAVATRFDEETLPELHIHFSKLAERKKERALRYLDFIAEAGQSAVIGPIGETQTEFPSTEAVVKRALENEIAAIEGLDKIVHMAKEEFDEKTQKFLEEPLKTQSEEVLLARELLGTVQKAGESNLLQVEEFLIQKTSVSIEV